MTRLTILTTTYNYPGALDFAIRSALAQTHEDFEYLIVGDGCTDETADVVAGFNDPRIRWRNLPENLGNQADVSRIALADVKDGLVAYLNHDDLWFPEHLQTLVAAIDNDRDIANTLCLAIAPPPLPHRQILGTARRPQDGTGERPVSCVTSTVMHTAAAYHRTAGWAKWRETSGQSPQVLFREIRMLRDAYAVVPSITALKFHSAQRRDSYVHKSTDELAHWWSLMQTDSDLRLREAMIAHTLHMASVPFPHMTLGLKGKPPPGWQIEHFRRLRGLPPMLDIGEIAEIPLKVTEPCLEQTDAGLVFAPPRKDS